MTRVPLDAQLRTVLVYLLSAIVLASGCGGSGTSSVAPLSLLDNPTNARFVFVDGTNGRAAGAGTKEDPLDAIQAGIGLAASSGKSVCVARGVYSVDNSAGTQIRMDNTVSLYGGYNHADNAWTRNVVSYSTTIRDLSASGGSTYDNVNAAVSCGYGGTSGSGPVIDGFTIQGGCGAYSAAVWISPGSSVTVSNCAIFAGTATAHAYGIRNLPLNGVAMRVTVTGCTIGGGAGSAQTTGIEVSRSDLTVTSTVVSGLSSVSETVGINCGYGDVTIRNCEVGGGTVTSGTGWTYGMYVNEAYVPLIENNTVHGGAGGGHSKGIDMMDTEAAGTIRNNDIDGGTGTMSSALDLGWMSVYPTVDGNHFRASGGTTRYGIYEENSGGSPVFLRNNTFHASLLGGTLKTAFYRDYTLNLETLVIDVSTLNGIDEMGLNPVGSVSGNVAGA